MTDTVSALSVTDVANELGTNELSVFRLIARGALPATRLGDDVNSHYRITPRQLSAYVDGGANDFKDLDDGRSWFLHHGSLPDVMLRKAYVEAAVDQEPTQEQLLAAGDGTIARPEMTVNVRSTPAIREASNMTPADADPWKNKIVRQRGRDRSQPFGLLDLFIGDQIYVAARDSLRTLSTRRKDGKQDPRNELFRLYDSTQSYGEATKSASETVQGIAIRWHKTMVIDNGPSVQPRPSVRVHFVLPLEIAAGNRGALKSRIATMTRHVF